MDRSSRIWTPSRAPWSAWRRSISRARPSPSSRTASSSNSASGRGTRSRPRSTATSSNPTSASIISWAARSCCARPPRRGARAGAAGGGPNPRVGRRAAGHGAQDGRYPPRPRLLMSADPLPSAFAEEVSRPDSEINLARAALLIALSEFPDLDIAGYLRRLDELALGVGEGGRAADPLQRLHRLREYLFEEQGFAGNIRQYYDPRNSYLNEVLDRRLGIPITLSLVLSDVGRRLGLGMEGIGLPGHFITGA